MSALFYVNTFINNSMLGNPAAVLLLEEWLPDIKLQALAVEIGLPATGFLIQTENTFSIRWFTVDYELNLCGHASLAASHVIFEKLKPALQQIKFDARTTINARRENDLVFLDLPRRSIQDSDHPLLAEALGIKPQYIYQQEAERCLAVFETEEEIRALKPDMELLKQLPFRGFDVTAPGTEADFVCRTFYPNKTLTTEDQVCGAAHCILIPYWGERFNKNKLISHQLSERGGELVCLLEKDKVYIGGKSAIYKQKVCSM